MFDPREFRDETDLETEKITSEDEVAIIELSRNPKIYEKIRKSIAPTIHGCDDIKDAVALQLFSGVPKVLSDGTRIRGDIHIILIGDTGTAKSKILKYIEGISPLSEELSDRHYSGRKPNLSIFDGIFKRASGGIVILDNLDRISGEALCLIEEVAEKQTISRLNDGTINKQECKCSFLAALSPKNGLFDEYEPIISQISHSLLSLIYNFDLIFILLNNFDLNLDSQKADHILKSNFEGELAAQMKSRYDMHQKAANYSMATFKPEIEPQLLRKYIKYAKNNIFPVLTDKSNIMIKNRYLTLRREIGDANKSPPITARQLETLIRLSEASARIRLSNEISAEDADRAAKLLRSCLQRLCGDHEKGFIDADIIAEGLPNTIRDRTKIIVDIIKEVIIDCQGDASEEEVLNRAKAQGMDRSKTEEIINRLRRDGSLYETKPGLLRLS